MNSLSNSKEIYNAKTLKDFRNFPSREGRTVAIVTQEKTLLLQTSIFSPHELRKVDENTKSQETK